MGVAILYLFFGFVFLTILANVIEHSITEETAQSLHYWMQFVTGTWPIDESKDRMSFLFSAAISVNILLATVPLLGVLAIFQRIADVEWRSFMKYADFIKLRDGLLVRDFVRNFPEEEREVLEERLIQAIYSAHEDLFETQLRHFVGEENVAAMRNVLEREIEVVP